MKIVESLFGHQNSSKCFTGKCSSKGKAPGRVTGASCKCLPGVVCVLMLISMVSLLGCNNQKKQISDDDLQTPVALDVTYHAGSPLAGPANVTVQLPADLSANVYQVQVKLLNHFETKQGQPLDIYAKLITTTRGETAFLSASAMTQPIRWLRDTNENSTVSINKKSMRAAGRVIVASEPKIETVLLLEQATLQLNLPLVFADATAGEPKPDASRSNKTKPLPPKVTMAMRLVQAQTPQQVLMDSQATSAEVNLSAATGPVDDEKISTSKQLRLVVSLTDFDSGFRQARTNLNREAIQAEDQEYEAGDGKTKVGQRRTPTVITETLVVDLPFDVMSNDFSGSVVVPYDVPGKPWRAMVVSIQNTRQQVTPELLDKVNASLSLSKEKAALVPTLASKLFASDQTELSAAFNLFESAQRRRSAMVFVAGRTKARLLGDLALVADDLWLELYATRIKKVMSELPADQPASLGWVLDRTCISMLIEQTGQPVARETQGVMATYFGEVASRPALLEELVNSSPIRATFDTLTLAENVISLEDDSPASRVHAFNWLRRQGVAPEGYDPLASSQSRQKALETANAGPGSGTGEKAGRSNGLFVELLPLAPTPETTEKNKSEKEKSEKDKLPATGTEGTQ